VYVTPALAPMQLGRGYASLSLGPFDFSEQNNLRFRILTPLIAYLLGLRGSLYIILPLLVAIFFLGLIYRYSRKTETDVSSFLITAMICFSTPILFLLHFQGYVDITSYTLILLIMMNIRKRLLVSVLTSLLLLNHDSNVFILPAIFYYLCITQHNKRYGIISTATIMVPAVIIFFVYRYWVNSNSPVDFNAENYFGQTMENIKTIAAYFPVGFFYAFKLFWILPILAFYHYWREKNIQIIILWLLILAAALGQLLIASDTSRLIGLAFPLIIFSAFKMHHVWGQAVFQKRVFYLLIFNFLIPQYYVGQSTMIPFYPLPVSWYLRHYCGIETWIG
jgi:hypothetical protein